jgi:hypothetical protein
LGADSKACSLQLSHDPRGRDIAGTSGSKQIERWASRARTRGSVLGRVLGLSAASAGGFFGALSNER